MKKKTILVGIAIILCLIMCLYGLSYKTVKIEGVIGDADRKATVVIKYRRCTDLLNLDCLYGSVTVLSENGKEKIKSVGRSHRFYGGANDCYLVAIDYYNAERNQMMSASLYCDKKLENVIVLEENTDFEFIAADEAFRELVDNYRIK